MLREESRDASEKAQTIVEKHQLDYSLIQLRLVGILLLLVLATRFIGVVLSFAGPPIEVLAAITTLSNWLPLLPLGISLYLLGGGRQRQPREFVPARLLHKSLVPLALACLLLLPSVTLFHVVQLSGEMTKAQAQDQLLVQRQNELLRRTLAADASAEVQALALQYGIDLPAAPAEPVGLTNWRLARSLELELSAARKSSVLLSLSPYQRELLSPFRNVSTLMMQLITGVGLLLLHHQGSREIRRHGMGISLFFQVDPEHLRRRVSY
jgi:hypothetical protein